MVGVAVSFGITILGPTLNLPDWVLGINPFHHLPNVAATAPDWTGFCQPRRDRPPRGCIVGFRRRDIHRV
jgi:ABC-2 type transport system permease protein